MSYSYKKSSDLRLIERTGRIMGLDFRYGSRYGEDIAKIRGQLQTLFGDPVYTYPDPEGPYGYVIVMKNEHGVRYNFHVYSGKSGPSIGGNIDIDGIEDAAQELKKYIAKASPSDYEFQGTCSDRYSVIMGVKDGEPYYTRTEIGRKAKKRKPTFEEVFTKAGLIPEWIKRGWIQGVVTAARNALNKGLPVDVVNDITGMDIETIKKTEPIIEEQIERIGLEAYLNTIIRANPEAFLEAREMGDVATFDRALTEAKIIPEWIEEGREQGLEYVARNAIIKGLPIDVIHDITGMSINKIKKLAMNK
jgi:hypothetical protein